MINKGSIVKIDGCKGKVDRVFGGFAYIVFPMVGYRRIHENGWYSLSKLQ